MIQKKITILTKSGKDGGYCVAGVDEYGKWIRLVSTESGGALEKGVCSFNVLDIISATVDYKPIKFQPENAILYKYTTIGQDTISSLVSRFPTLLQKSGFLFANTVDKLVESQMHLLQGSLLIAEAINFEIKQIGDRYKAYFTHLNNEYEYISVTAWGYYKCCAKHEKAYIVMSLPPSPYPTTNYFKFVAAIFPTK